MTHRNRYRKRVSIRSPDATYACSLKKLRKNVYGRNFKMFVIDTLNTFKRGLRLAKTLSLFLLHILLILWKRNFLQSIEVF